MAATSKPEWTLRERLTLVSIVHKIGQNVNDWNGVSKAMRPHAEANGRTPDFFTFKNCAAEYSKILEQQQSASQQQRGARRRSVQLIDTAQIVSNLTLQYIDQISDSLNQQQVQLKCYKKEIDQVTAGKVPQEQLQFMLERAIAEDQVEGIKDDDPELEKWRQRLRDSGWKINQQIVENVKVADAPLTIDNINTVASPVEMKPMETKELEKILDDGDQNIDDDDTPLAHLVQKVVEPEIEPESKVSETSSPKPARTSPRKRLEHKSSLDSNKEAPSTSLVISPHRPSRRSSAERISTPTASPLCSRPTSPTVEKTSIDPDVPGGFETMADYKHWRTQTLATVKAVAAHKHANVFANPVSETLAPGYKEAIKSPMDLTTLKKMIEHGQVTSTAEFKRHLMLMFTNAIMFNSTGHYVHNMAKEMAKDSAKIFKEMMNNGTQNLSAADIVKAHRNFDTHTTTRRSLRGSGALL